MTRKELYSKVKELNLADEIKKKYGDNYTRVSSENLEKAVVDAEKFLKKNAEVKEEIKDERHVAFIPCPPNAVKGDVAPVEIKPVPTDATRTKELIEILYNKHILIESEYNRLMRMY